MLPTIDEILILKYKQDIRDSQLLIDLGLGTPSTRIIIKMIEAYQTRLSNDNN